MKGTLHKTESGWVVKYYIMRESSHAIHPNEHTLPILDHGYVNGPGLSDSDEGLEVEFQVIEFPVPPTNGPINNSISKYAQLIDNWLTMKEGDITVNFKPMPEFDEPNIHNEYPSKLHQLQIQAAEACFRKYPNNEILYPTDELKDAYKAGVIDGLKEWTLDSYDRPKYPEVNIICPRCKALMPCECNTTRQTSLLNSIRDNSSWDTIFTEFHIATQQVEIGTPQLIFECWLVDNYNPPTKKQN